MHFLSNLIIRISELLTEFRHYSLYELRMKPRSHHVIEKVVSHFEAYLDVDELSDVTKSDVRTYLYEMQEQRNWKAKTFSNKRQYLKTFFDFCIEYEYIKHNPVSGIKKQKVPKPAPRYLTKEEVHQVLSAIRWHDWKYSFEGERNETIVALAAMTGLRNAEIRDLKVKDANLSEGWIFVRCGKGDKFRYVPIPDKLPKILSRWLKIREVHGIDSEYLFVGVIEKKQLKESMMLSIFQKLSEISGVYISCHMLRHSYGFACANSGVNPRAVQKAMGHSCIRTTMRYSDISLGAIKEQISAASLI